MKNPNVVRFATIKIYMLLLLVFGAHIQSEAQKLGSNWDEDTLLIRNELIEIKCKRSSHGLELFSLRNKELDQSISFNECSQVFSIDHITDSAIGFESKSIIVKETSSSRAYLNIENDISYEKMDIRIEFRLYEGSPMLAIDFFVKKNVENLNFKPEETSMVNMQLKGKHWLFKAVEFFDFTDFRNTLVQEHEGLLFRYPLQLNGNVLFAKNLINQNTIVILKEAPCSYAQLHSPGFDFCGDGSLLSVKGIGVSPEDLTVGEWIPTYSTAIGVSDDSEIELLTTVRKYQKNWRKNLADRDEMIMMNTWGDMNHDSQISEQFLKREIEACNMLGITHFQVDDGWQKGRSSNSSDTSNIKLWNKWAVDSWQPDPIRFPNGFKVVRDFANEHGVQLGLWFAPSSENEYATWKQDAAIIIGLYNDYGIRYFKIDGVKIPSKRAEQNLRKFLDTVLMATNSNVVFNLDLTHNKRGGYFYIYEYGNIFLENRYTGVANYYPYWTLRNLWHLSKYTPAEKYQIEFLNNQNYKEQYTDDDIFAPSNIPFDYTFALTMMAQPLAWFEGSNLYKEGYSIAPLIEAYQKVQAELHSGLIFPVGDEPSGRSWTGFQSILSEESGYVLIFRENNLKCKADIKLYHAENRTIRFEKVLGHGENFEQSSSLNGGISFSLPVINSFVLYKYSSQKQGLNY